jgi:hypothetical protein
MMNLGKLILTQAFTCISGHFAEAFAEAFAE